MSKYADMMEQLNSFEHPDYVAAFLKSKGIKGEVQDGEACVITNWFLTETDARGCSTTESSITILDEIFEDLEFQTSDALYLFIEKFDNYAYPSLVIDHEDDGYWN